MSDILMAPLEIKLAGESGEFEGYASVFGVVDGHNDVVSPFAFRESLAERKARGDRIPMHLNHGLAAIGGVRGVGVWRDVGEDDSGLKVAGTILGINTDAGRYLYERVKGGGIPGLSIGYTIRPGGSARGKHGGRAIRAADLKEISIVDTPSNARSLITQIKAAIGLGGGEDDPDTIGARLARGEEVTQRDMERALREKLVLSHAQAARFAAGGIKSLARESEGEATSEAGRQAIRDLAVTLSGFSLPSFRS